MALPGDTVQMRGRQLVLNGQPVPYRLAPQARQDDAVRLDGPALAVEESFGAREHLIHWSDARALAPDFGPLTVPADHYLMLGDNRDHSGDSRFFGLVERRLLIGKAERILVSAAIQDHWQLRITRFGAPLR